jgi:hypothetical protein
MEVESFPGFPLAGTGGFEMLLERVESFSRCCASSEIVASLAAVGRHANQADARGRPADIGV